MNIKTISKLIVITYVLLTIIKVFTVHMNTTPGGMEPGIYFKIQPTVSNVFAAGEEHETLFVDYYTWRHSWYRDQQYWNIISFNMYSMISDIYVALIATWWFLSAGLVGFGLFKVYSLGSRSRE